MKKMNKKISRRNALKTGVATAGAAYFSPMQVLFESIFNGIMAKAHAQTTGITAKNYVFIQLYGAPPRWTWDPLNPFDPDSSIHATPQVGTRYVDGTSYTAVEYKTSQRKGVNMPWMWQFDVPKSDGSTRPMDELMDSMLIMRGVDCGNTAHSGASFLQFTPLGINTSLTALSADQNDNPIPHISMNTIDAVWASEKKKAKVELGHYGNLLDKLLDPFMSQETTTFKNNKNKIDQALKDSMANFESYAKASHPELETIAGAQSSALELLRSSFDNIDTEFNSRVAKYTDLIDRAKNPLGTSLVGLTDKPIDDPVDIRSSYNKAIPSLAAYFAVVEYVLVNQLSSSIAFRAKGMQTFDEHSVLPIVSLLINTMFNRSIAACCLELSDVLKANSMWDDTLINISGEFGRNPQNAGTGSDHCPPAGSVTLLSGSLKGSEVIGNVVQATTAGRNGTYGYGGNNPGVGRLNMGHLANTVSTILGTPNPVTAVSPLVTEVNGKFQATLPGGKLV